MRNCDLHTGASRIRKGLEQIELIWEQASDDWNDQVSHKFREQYLEPLIPEVKLALDAIARLQLLVDEVQKDCDG